MQNLYFFLLITIFFKHIIEITFIFSLLFINCILHKKKHMFYFCISHSFL